MLSGCVDEYGNSNNAGAGTVAGVLGGAFIGSQMGGGSGGGAVAGGLIGAALGGVVGNKIGARLDAKSRARIQETSYYALDKGRIGEHYSWRSEQASGYVVPTREYYVRQEYSERREYENHGNREHGRDRGGRYDNNHRDYQYESNRGNRHEEYNNRGGSRGRDMQCREYMQKVNIGGREETAYGKACRQPDGQWKIIQS